VNRGRVVVMVAAAVVAVAAVVTVALQLRDLAAVPTTAPSTEDTPTPVVADAGPGAPTRVTIPAIGVDAALVPVGLKDDGSMQTPDFGAAAWYEPGPRPGEPGPAVVVAHVDSAVGGLDVFGRLRELRPGDQVTVHYPDSARTFVVTDLEQTAKADLPTTRIWNGTTAPVLRLITCGGAFDRGARSYLDNIVVYADRLV